jgi:hypothetical protein
MDIEAAKRAGELAKSIEARIPMLALVDECIAGDYRIFEVRARNPATGQEYSLVLSALDSNTSQMSLSFIKQIYEGQLATLNADLATAETWTP